MNRLPAPRPQLLDITPQTIVAGRLLSDYIAFHHHRDHAHSIDSIVGYVIRETIRDGQTLWGDDSHTICGYDVQAIEGGHRYADTFPLRDFLRGTYNTYRDKGGYAVVDSLYACGCRGGNPIPQPHAAQGR